jgi:hypothetical protein
VSIVLVTAVFVSFGFCDWIKKKDAALCNYKQLFLLEASMCNRHGVFVGGTDLIFNII